MIIAIDGPAASGKGTLARRLAGYFGLAYLDTGMLYRAVAIKLLRGGQDPADAGAAEEAARSFDLSDLENPDLRNDDVANAAGIVGAHPQVRASLASFQRSFAARPKPGTAGVVMDGRDIGTVICPEAGVKFFVTATTEVRAQRRLKELRQRGVESIYDRVLQDMIERDARDRTRAVSPLTAADDGFRVGHL